MKIITIAHGTIAESICTSLEMIIGKIDDLYAINLQSEETPDDLHEKIEDHLLGWDEEPVLFMVDFIGGTPFQVCSKFVNRPNTRCICGFNVSMLIHAALSHDVTDMDKWVASIVRAGKENICRFPPNSKNPTQADIPIEE